MDICDEKAQFNGGFVIHMLNATEFEDRKLLFPPVTARFAANHVPTENGGIKTFSDIAQMAKGSKHLGILKADVDNLGFVFMEGFSQRYSVSRVSTLSRMLDLFFSGYVNVLLEKEFTNVYSVFSGGDDLFLVGPWDKMPELALRLNRDFRAYAAGNPCFTITAAVTLENAVSNVKTFSQTCEHRLKQAKTQSDETVYPEKDGRDAVWFFNHFFTWEDFEKYLADGRKLEQWIGAGLANTSQLRRVAGYSGMYKDFLQMRTLDSARFDGLFKYDLRRNYPGDGPRREVRDWAAALRDNSLNYKNRRKDFYFAGFCVDYALNKTREKRGRGRAWPITGAEVTEAGAVTSKTNARNSGIGRIPEKWVFQRYLDGKGHKNEPDDEDGKGYCRRAIAQTDLNQEISVAQVL